ncbi:GGDEF domain-containing protein [Catenovulum maritimum]|uniref:GGDEF domain-containing protein n=1 Tax=Catenovulum maritimum TaxID=1513271 RepID=A0A0J8GU49_9ALTE|nr:GGDEF domain-containing protein [Catenovulum maritimum]KMT66267.1 hypothetical protein XM47_04555 [Catenovulum maritimum]
MKINLKLAIYVASMAIFAMLIISYSSYQRILNNSQSESNTAIKSLVATVYDAAAVAAYLNNQSLADDVVNGLLKNNIVLCASIKTEEISNQLGQICNTEQYKEQLISPFDEQESIGEIIIYKNELLVKEKAQNLAKSEIIGSSWIVIISSIVAWVVTYLLVSHPIENLTQELAKVDLNSDHPSHLKESLRNDEIGIIRHRVNELLTKLDERINKERTLAMQTQMLSNNFKMICELSTNALAVTDQDLVLKSYNPKFKELWQKNSGLNEIILDDLWLERMCYEIDEVKQEIISCTELNHPHTVEIEIINSAHPESEQQWFNLTYTKAENMFGELNTFIFLNDVTQQRKKLLQTEFEADHDTLTHLKNRRSARRIIEQYIANKDMSSELGLLVIDLDGFKAVNDTYGHDAGDLVLIELANRIKKLTRKSDLVARWGGDEFVVALNNANQSQVESIAEKIVIATQMAIPLNAEVSVNLGSSIGVAMFPASANSFEKLFDNADFAMYQVKKQGKNNYSVFDWQES